MRVPGIPYVEGRNSYSDADGKHFGIAIHNTSNNASDSAEASYATRRTDGVSSHFYCDRDSVTQSIDTNNRVGHAGSRNGNENAIAVEITGANGWSRSQWLANVAWDQLGRVLAYVITHDPDYKGFQVRRASVTEMRANPKVRAFYGHDDMRRAWGGTTHTDPGPGFPWDKLFAEVNKALNLPKPEAATARKKVPDMFLIKTAKDATVYLCNGTDRVALSDPTKQLKPLQDAGVPLITAKDNAELALIGGPERTAG